MPSQHLKQYSTEPRGEVCQITFLRWAMFLFLSIFLLTGFVMIGFGVYTITQNISVIPLLSIFYPISVFGLTAVGGLVLLSSIIGCHSANQERYRGIIMFTIFLILIFLTEVSLGVIAFVQYTKVMSEGFSKELSLQLVSQWGINEKFTQAVDDFQIKNKCCGSEYYTEWKMSEKVKALSAVTPDSCCMSPVHTCGQLEHLSNLNDRGCATYLKEHVRFSIYLIPAILLGFSLIQIFGVIFSCALALQVKRRKQYFRSQYSFT